MDLASNLSIAQSLPVNFTFHKCYLHMVERQLRDTIVQSPGTRALFEHEKTLVLSRQSHRLLCLRFFDCFWHATSSNPARRKP